MTKPEDNACPQAVYDDILRTRKSALYQKALLASE